MCVCVCVRARAFECVRAYISARSSASVIPKVPAVRSLKKKKVATFNPFQAKECMPLLLSLTETFFFLNSNLSRSCVNSPNSSRMSCDVFLAGEKQFALTS